MSAYVVTEPALVRQLLVPGDLDYVRGRVFDKLEHIFGSKSLITTSGAEHRQMRRMLQPAFHQERIADYSKHMIIAAEDIAASWLPGQTVDVETAMSDLAIAGATSSLFSASPVAAASAVIQQNMPIIMRGVFMRTVLPASWEKLPTPGNRNYAKAISAVHRILDDTIAGYRSSGSSNNDLLSMLLAVRDEDGQALSDRQIRDHMASFFIAAVETTGITLAWILYEIGNNPEAESNVHAEIDTVLGGRPVEYSDLVNLTHVGRVITEALRLHPPTFFSRRALRPVRFGEITLPAGAEIFCSPYTLAHDKRWFPEPQTFDPDRWLPERVKDLPRGAFIPFSAGAHKCIGDSFAVTEITMAVASICAQWRLRPVPNQPVHELIGEILRPRSLPMIAERRRPTRTRPSHDC
jgi:cytochrome P450